ncbi:intraflagellar transporter-like protein, putative (macronuclear) [Tetrahymena thermophila SB210]|uniref:Intraflagellar transporter-like protein, putative n=1 Tax=Tetrahymena thermophila (strain SB210) TaxID=312017 RepID=I7LWB4_TETTS|nr:intraflagellar transporter-like protein, putative [Tetrahymena thermophila SB210]EAS01313.2 intraflagellar transporter-like protein, putative [Tetrahymena thermophila SB210]|eukprot:XP_001021558.2 intraflagellar transporter-like protein, putative [Tetrahymena thermophila SB210]
MDPRIPTAQKTGMRPLGTAMKPGTAMRGEFGFNAGQAANLKIVDRPVTKGGMMGISTKPQTQGRAIQDRGYFMTLLRNKISEIQNEIKVFKDKIEQIQQDNTTYNSLQKRFDDLIKEVRNLEGQLADYNLASDKQRSKTRPEEIHNMYQHIKLQNQRKADQLDEIFLERKRQEEEIQKLEMRIHEINQQAEQKITELDPEQRQEYENLLQENRQLNNDINLQRNELEEINIKLQQTESRLNIDSQKLKGKYLKEQIIELERKREDLELQLNEANLSFPEARDKLKARVAEDNALLAQTEKRTKEIQKNIDNYEKRIREINAELNGGAEREAQKQKYEIIYQKDKEMNDFIQNYQQFREREIEQINSIEQNIITLLENSSKILSLTGNLPSQADYTQIIGNFKFQEGMKENSENTLVMIEKQVETLKESLKQLETLEEKLAQKKEKQVKLLEQWNTDIDTKYNRIDQFKREFEQKEKRLLKDREELNGFKNQISEQLKNVTYDYNLKEKKLNMHESYPSYTEAEKKFSNCENQVNNLRNFIITKTKDMDYENIKEECKKLVDDINRAILKN